MPQTFDAARDLAGDLEIPTRLIAGEALTVQRAEVRLGTHLGGWILDRFQGLPFADWRQQKPPDVAGIGAVLIAELTDTPGVIRVDSWDGGTFDPVARVLRYSGVVIIEADGEPVDQIALAFAATVGGGTGGNSTPAVSFVTTSARVAPM